MTATPCNAGTSHQLRCSPVEIVNQNKAIGGNRQLLDLMDSLPGLVLVLNQTRQIVFANQSFLHFLGVTCLLELLGKKPGEALACEHAMQSVLGCGATDFCSTCGATKATNFMPQLPKGATHECRIRQEGSGKSFDFRVRTAPFPGADNNLHLFFLTDISHEKRRRALERIFFHDVANIATGMMGLSQILRKKELEPAKKKQCQDALYNSAHRLANEVEAQKTLAVAENNELRPQIGCCTSLAMLTEVAAFYNNGDYEQNNRLEIAADAAAAEFYTDPRLLFRILINITKNAVEASPQGAEVRLGCNQVGNDLEFWVHNQGHIPGPVQKQIFERSFSTKGSGRGLGTYSIKLLGEHYLKGRISFTSSPDEGTIFRFRCPRNHEAAKSEG
jgi:hypothetical protein